jgi:hypothetical protein
MKDAIRELMPVAKLVLGVCLFFWSVDCLVVEDRINSTSVLTIFGLGFWAPPCGNWRPSATGCGRHTSET